MPLQKKAIQNIISTLQKSVIYCGINQEKNHHHFIIYYSCILSLRIGVQCLILLVNPHETEYQLFTELLPSYRCNTKGETSYQDLSFQQLDIHTYLYYLPIKVCNILYLNHHQPNRVLPMTSPSLTNHLHDATVI